MLADSTLDVCIADLLETKLKLISAVETDEPLDGSLLEDLYRLCALGPALLQESRVASISAAVLERLEKLAAATPRATENPLLSGGVQEFRSSIIPADRPAANLVFCIAWLYLVHRSSFGQRISRSNSRFSRRDQGGSSE
jgi:hypothetical protein